MIINGIVAEYNPFHNGHKYQVKSAKNDTNADYTVVVMSGNFVQRGGPAILDKHSRTTAALSNGADLVLELPTLYAAASAEFFAAGAIRLLNDLGVVTDLNFGSECGNIQMLQDIAECLVHPSEAYNVHLQNAMKEGKSFPAARSYALSKVYPSLSAEALSSPNNILGIEYCKALKKLNSTIVPSTIKRSDDGYHSLTVSDNICTASASAIRNALDNNISLSSLANVLPAESIDALQTCTLGNDEALSSLLYYKLLSEQSTGYEAYLDVTRELSDKISNHLREYRDFSSFCDLLKTKELTHSRIRRALLHILLNIKKEEYLPLLQNSVVPYARVLGFRKDASPLLSAIKEHSRIPLLTKLADAEPVPGSDYEKLLSLDIFASNLYYGLYKSNDALPYNEYTRQIVIL